MKLSASTKIALGGLGLVSASSAASGVRSFYRRSMSAMYPENYTAMNAGGSLSSQNLPSQPSAINGMRFSFRRK